MNDLKKQAQILTKRNGFWIMLVFILTLLFTGIALTKRMESRYFSLIISTNELNEMGRTGKEYNYNTRIDKEFFKENDILYKKLSKKYGYDKYEKFEYERASEDEIRKHEEYYLENEARISPLSDYYYHSENIKSGYRSDILLSMGIVLVVVLSLLFTSLEHATSYYEFSRMYPWSRRKDFLMKIILGFFLILAFTILGSLLSFMIIKTSKYDAIKIGMACLPEIIRSLSFLVSIFLILMSTGLIAGNIFGHFGLSIWVMFFLDFIDLIIAGIKEVFLGNSWYGGFRNLLDQVFKGKSGFDKVIRSIIRPITDFDGSKESLIGILIFAIILVVIALILIKWIRTEESGRMILIKPVEVIAKYMLILLVGTYGTIVFKTSILEGFSIINIFVFGILIFVFTKVFNILFKVKLKV